MRRTCPAHSENEGFGGSGNCNRKKTFSSALRFVPITHLLLRHLLQVELKLTALQNVAIAAAALQKKAGMREVRASCRYAVVTAAAAEKRQHNPGLLVAEPARCPCWACDNAPAARHTYSCCPSLRCCVLHQRPQLHC